VLVDAVIVEHIDADAWAMEQAAEESEREVLLKIAGESA
jgi:hypothetical protein